MRKQLTLAQWLTQEWFAFFILLIGVLCTVIFAVYVNQAAFEKEELQFQNFVTRTQDSLLQQIDRHTAILRATAGFFEGNDESITAESFTLFVSQLELIERYPSMLNLGYAPMVTPENRLAFEAEQRESVPEYTIQAPPSQETIFPTTFLEPKNQQNQTAIGFDQAADPNRWRAMEKARDTGLPTATGIVSLHQEMSGEVQPGFVLYYPLYRTTTESALTTVQQRRENLIGFLYIPFLAEDFFLTIPALQSAPTGLYFSVYEGEQLVPSKLLYSSQPRNNEEYQRFLESSPFREVNILQIGDPLWTVEFSSNPQFGDSLERELLPIVLTGGLTISFLLFLLARAQFQARLVAEKRTSELRLSQQELRQSRGQYQLVVEHTEDLVNLLDMEARYIYASPSHRKILGYDASDLMEKSILEFIHDDDRKTVEKVFEKIKTGKPAKTVYRFRHRRGQYITLEGVGSGITDERGVPYVMVTTSRDVSQRVELERRKDEFIRIASHELKTPVTSIKAYTQYLLTRFQRAGDASSAQLLEKMDRQLNKLSLLISDLLDITKIESGKLLMVKQLFDLNQVVAEVVEEMQRTTEQHTILIEGQVATELHGDPDRIAQVIINFLSNAIKYSPQGEKIWVRLSSTRTQAQVSVQDQGIGVPHERQRKIFTRFFRVEGNKEETFPGLGLGLYISAQIIRRHQGKIWVESEPGQGSNFCFTLPLSQPFSARAVKTQKSRKIKTSRS